MSNVTFVCTGVWLEELLDELDELDELLLLEDGLEELLEGAEVALLDGFEELLDGVDVALLEGFCELLLRG